MIPLIDKNRGRSFPAVNILLIILNTAVFIIALRTNPEAAGFQLSYIPSRAFIFQDIYRIISHMFMHASIPHLVSNMIFLWVFGDNVEDRLGKGNYLFFYLLGGICAAALHTGISYIQGAENIPVVGASGAISAVMGAYLVFYPKAKILSYIFPFFFVELPALIYILIWFIMQFISSITEWNGSSVAYFAHIGGFLFGVVFAMILSSKKRRNS